MPYIPHTTQDIGRMLKVIGADQIDELFLDIPEKLKLQRSLHLDEALAESDLLSRFTDLGQENKDFDAKKCFIGGGAYQHHIPSVVPHLISRTEFSTAYTPYQPEISQGTLQAMFEFQSLISQLTGGDVSNASMYDGATATAEAVLMALRIRRKGRVLLSRNVHPHYLSVIKTYLTHQQRDIVPIEVDEEGNTSVAALDEACDEETAVIAVQYPGFFGGIDDLAEIAQRARANNAIFVCTVTEPLALGVLTPPGELGADIIAGEGQSFGIPLQFGGPYLGFLSCRKKFVRKMPGRLIGQTVDRQGKRGFVLTLATREQHIRREKATSNICTNQGLCALAAAITMTVLGKQGLHELAKLNMSHAVYAREKLNAIPSVTVKPKGAMFNEFCLHLPGRVSELCDFLHSHGVIGGIPIERFNAERRNELLLAVTEVNPKAEIDALASLIESFYSGK